MARFYGPRCILQHSNDDMLTKHCLRYTDTNSIQQVIWFTSLSTCCLPTSRLQTNFHLATRNVHNSKNVFYTKK